MNKNFVILDNKESFERYLKQTNQKEEDLEIVYFRNGTIGVYLEKESK